MDPSSYSSFAVSQLKLLLKPTKSTGVKLVIEKGDFLCADLVIHQCWEFAVSRFMADGLSPPAPVSWPFRRFKLIPVVNNVRLGDDNKFLFLASPFDLSVCRLFIKSFTEIPTVFWRL